MRIQHGIALVVLVTIWGASLLLIWVAAPVLGLFVLIELRVLIAGVAVLIVGWRPLALSPGMLRAVGGGRGGRTA